MPQSIRETAECGFEGNSDTYGLGVRLGIYLSWLSIIIAAAWFPKIIGSLTDGLLVFLVAFLAATILVSTQNQKTYAVEIVVMAYLYFGGLVTCSLSILAAGVRRPAEKHPVSLWRGTIMYITAIAMGLYHLWFYWGPERFMDTPCGTWLFPFGNVETENFRHSWVLIYAIVSIVVGVSWPLTAVAALILFIPDMVTILARLFPKLLGKWTSDCSLYGKSVANLGKGVKIRYLRSRQVARRRADRSKRMTRHLILAACVLVLVWSITGVELMLYKNSIASINTLAATGQLIPFIIGVATVTKLAFNAMSEDYEPPRLTWGFFFYEEQKVLTESERQSVNLLQRG
ncbi:uncharacterized protein RAG0_01570 [Rhynchosporium agropyri]|uniref:Uncharacterized protein n=1 Tax=Rhynchosporium agropyri TaxID=914238 RepID=A0A1E1JXR8_9HELO|nr:uncharacterized protein RAG0_01570 [Rhynchosporium agropyri]